MPETTYLVSTNLSPERLLELGCSNVMIAAVAEDYSAVAAPQGPRTMARIADTLGLSELRRSAMPSWHSLSPPQQLDVLAAALHNTVDDHDDLVDWLTNQEAWEWLIPHTRWQDQVEDALLHRKKSSQSTSVHVVVDTSSSWPDQTYEHSLTSVAQALRSSKVDVVTFVRIDRYLMSKEKAFVDRLHRMENPGPPVAPPESYFNQIEGPTPDLVVCLSRQPEELQSPPATAPTLWLNPDQGNQPAPFSDPHDQSLLFQVNDLEPADTVYDCIQNYVAHYWENHHGPDGWEHFSIPNRIMPDAVKVKHLRQGCSIPFEHDLVYLPDCNETHIYGELVSVNDQPQSTIAGAIAHARLRETDDVTTEVHVPVGCDITELRTLVGSFCAATVVDMGEGPRLVDIQQEHDTR